MYVSNMHLTHGSKKLNQLIYGNRSISRKIACRDPFILLADGKYYLYQNGASGIMCSVSEDLEHFSDPVTVFGIPESFHGIKDLFWAPECHYYKGDYYIFTSVFSRNTNHRNISVYRSEDPLGPFTDIASGCITPKDWDTIDGTLYVDEEGKPWMVFVHEWTCMPDGNGGMCCARLAEDFTHLEGEIHQLFLAKDSPFATEGVTDGPYLIRSQGSLFMIWSNFGKDGYFVTLARSEGGITGPWKQEKLLYSRGQKPEWTVDGGHAMVFLDKDDRPKLVLHGPNGHSDKEYEHVCLFNLTETDGTLFLE